METEPNIVKRPIGIWVIVCFFSLAYCLAIPAMVYAINNHPEVFENFSTFEIIVSILVMAITLVAIVYLFKMRAISFWLFLGAGIFSLIPLGIRLLTGQEILMPENMGFGGKIFEAVVWGVMVLYMWVLKTKGILK